MSVIVASGSPSTKAVDGEECEVIPFAGADKGGEFSSFGVGFLCVDLDGPGGSLWGLVMPHMLIQSWRAMKLLEHIPQIEHGTLCACWYAANERVHESDQRHIDELRTQFDNPGRFEALRAEVLALVPTNEELDAMLTIVRDNNVDVSVYELTRLVEQGKLAPHPIIEELAQKDEARNREYQEREAFIKAPMPAEESLGTLFEELRITNMLDGVPFGGYGFDWGHIKLEELDTYVKRYSTGEHSSEFPLRHTTKGPYSFGEDLMPGVKMISTTFGEIEEPYFVTSDGTRYTFTTAAFHEDSIVVTTKIEKEGSEPKEGTYTVPSFRNLIGPITPPEPEKKPRRSWHRK